MTRERRKGHFNISKRVSMLWTLKLKGYFYNCIGIALLKGTWINVQLIFNFAFYQTESLNQFLKVKLLHRLMNPTLFKSKFDLIPRFQHLNYLFFFLNCIWAGNVSPNIQEHSKLWNEASQICNWTFCLYSTWAT